MAVTMADITKLRKMTGAGMMDCKNALTEAEGDYDKAMEIIRKKGQAVAAKRSERDASEGCVLAKTTGEYAVVIALKCETDFVAQNADFVKLTQDILDLAVANKCKTLDEVKALPMGNGTVQDAVVDRSGITGEKMELDGYMTVEGASTAVYNHMNRNGLCTIVAFNKNVDEQLAKQVAMQIAAMNPIAIDEDGVSEEVKEKEIAVAIEKTKAEQVQKAVEAALKKANINPAHVDSEEHMESNMAKGWNIDPAAFAGLVAEDVKLRQRTIAIQLLNEIVQRSPVGNPELWAINATAVQYNKAVGEWNESLYADPANLTKTGRLRKKVRVNDSMDIRRPAEYRAGTFRASHFVSIGEPNHSVPTEPDPRGTMTFLNGKNIIDQAPAYSVIYIQSNLPYSVPLENGHSTQAPTGVYAVSFNGVIQAYK